MVAGAYRGGGKGSIVPQAPNDYRGAKKSKQCHKHVLQYSRLHLLPKDIKFEHGGAKRASCPGRCLTSLRPLSSTCDKVWVSSPNWGCLFRIWLSKLVQLSPRSAASIRWEKLLYTSKPISKAGPNSWGCFHLKTNQEALMRQCFSQW